MSKHGNTKREKYRRIADRCEVKAYVAPESMVQIARERTEGLVSYFVISRCDSSQLQTLAESAYMQGLHDALDMISGKYGDINKLAEGSKDQESQGACNRGSNNGREVLT